MLTEFAGNLAHHLEFGHALEIVGKTIDGASRCVCAYWFVGSGSVHINSILSEL